SMVLIIFIMLILSEALRAGLQSFRELKAVGDMQEKLRSTSMILRRDLAADHFEGRRRLSDPVEVWNFQGQLPRERFFRVISGLTVNEGVDGENIPSLRRRPPAAGASDYMLHFTVKLRGNNRDDFFTASAPPGSGGAPGSRLLSTRTTFFDQPT